MKSKKEMPRQYLTKFQDFLNNNNITNNIKLKKFERILRNNKGIIDFKNVNNKNYISPKNPLIVVLEDSVTGVHFEEVDIKNGILAQDQEDSYVDKFKKISTRSLCVCYYQHYQ